VVHPSAMRKINCEYPFDYIGIKAQMKQGMKHYTHNRTTRDTLCCRNCQSEVCILPADTTQTVRGT
jgi:hypothetical protein